MGVANLDALTPPGEAAVHLGHRLGEVHIRIIARTRLKDLHLQFVFSELTSNPRAARP